MRQTNKNRRAVKKVTRPKAKIAPTAAKAVPARPKVARIRAVEGVQRDNDAPAVREEAKEPIVIQTDYIEQWQSFGKDAFESVKELELIATKAADQLTTQQIDLVNTCVEASVAQFAAFGSGNGYKDVVTTQMELASGLTQKFVANARKTAELMNDLRNELTAWYETKLNDAAKAAVKKTPVKKAA